MSPLTVVAKVLAKNEAVEAVKTELLKMLSPTRQEAGCIDYRLHQDNQNPALFLFYETWESAASLQAHVNSQHYRHYVSAVNGKIAEKVVHTMTGIEDGNH